jgi:hypothetical protein
MRLFKGTKARKRKPLRGGAFWGSATVGRQFRQQVSRTGATEPKPPSRHCLRFALNARPSLHVLTDRLKPKVARTPSLPRPDSSDAWFSHIESLSALTFRARASDATRALKTGPPSTL